MERSTADRYLHKKFKKQLNIESNNIHNNQNTKRDETPSSSVVVSGLQKQHIQQQAKETNIEDLSITSNNNAVTTSKIISDDSVPNVSTNENTFINVTVLESSSSSSTLNLAAKSSISQERNVNVVSEERKSENSNNDKAGELFLNSTINSSNPNNSCISYVISKSSRIENLNQPESTDKYRVANFDTTARFNISQQEEPIRIIPSADQSSILENVYSKQYVTSKLVNVDKLGDISSSSSSNNDHHQHYHYHHQEEDNNNRNLTESNQTQQETTVEKSAGGGGGKYICSYCNLACSKPSVLQKHIRAHTNERPYPCVSCGFSFKTRSNLYKHCRSRTHANRVMGNKAQEINNEIDTDSQNNKMDISEQNETRGALDDEKIEENKGSVIVQDSNIRTKPYKPRFHTAKAFFEDISKDNVAINQKDAEDQKVPETVQNSRPSNSDLLSLHINEVINKNNAIVNSNEPYLLRKRSVESLDNNNQNNDVIYPPNLHLEEQRQSVSDEPLNLTNKGRKRCHSEVTDTTPPATPMHTSLIKELLLKNLYADSMQCPHCKMIFQTVTELELHKMRNCKGYQKSGARYSRSSSVNVASILTKNKNAFDNIPQLQNTVFPLKSPGPFLGKTRLVESDKSKSFSFDDGLPTFQNNNEILRTTLRYSISPLTIQQDKVKKNSVKLFGGEVKIHTPGETKSFKFDSKDNNDHFTTDYGGRLSENRVVKSSLQSGGTVLQNKQTYNPKQDSLTSSPDIIRVYNSTTLSPSIDITNLEKAKFNYERHPNNELESEQQQKTNSNLIVRPPTDVIGSSNFSSTTPSVSYKYTNIMDFSQKAVKLLAPNLKQPNLTIPGVPIPNKIVLSRSPSLPFEIKQEPSRIFDTPSLARSQTEHERSPIQPKNHEHAENIQFAQKQILLQQKMAVEPSLQSSNVNPMNLLVNGKVVRYVPGMPGPVAADVPLDVPYRASFRPQKPILSPKPLVVPMETHPPIDKPSEPSRISYNGPVELRSSKSLEVKISSESASPIKSSNLKTPFPLKPDSIKSPNHLNSSGNDAPRKFARPNTLALKPSLAAHKQHHGLTPTMFNQILISPDTPRVAKKYMQHFLHGNYFSYLGLKSSTKVVYCTLNKTQPTYVPHFKKLSMYSEWRQQDTKADKLYVSAYDSRQRQQKYVTAGKAKPDLIAHSSYKFIVTETSIKGEDNQKSNSILGGYESNEDYTYVRGRGRGRYVCDQCGIRCKKPSMLKKHIRTHTNDRPFTCSHCNFSFKTKGNLTKHMKSKAHTKNYAASSSSSSSSTHQSGTQSSESDTDDSGMDSSDESTRQQEHEAAYGLLSLSQKTTPNVLSDSLTDNFSTNTNPVGSLGISPVEGSAASFMNTEQVTQVNNTNFAKNKILDQQITLNFNASKIISETPSTSADSSSKEMQNLQQFLGKTNINRPLTYPYTSDVTEDIEKIKTKDSILASPVIVSASTSNYDNNVATHSSEHIKIEQRFNIIQKHPAEVLSPKVVESRRVIPITISYDPSYLENYKVHEEPSRVSPIKQQQPPVVKINDRVVLNNVPYNSSNITHSSCDIRKRKMSEVEIATSTKVHRINTEPEVMDLSMPSLEERVSPEVNVVRYNGASPTKENEFRTHLLETRTLPYPDTVVRNTPKNLIVEKTNLAEENNYRHNGTPPYEISEYNRDNENVINLKAASPQQAVDINYVIQENHPSAIITTFTEVPQSFSPMDYDNSAMETLAEVATKQVKLEKNTLAKSVASEYLKLATKQEHQTNDGIRETNNFITATKDNELIVKPEENKSCTICAKNFSKPSQLRLHMNIHYLERPFRCDPCSVSFRTKGHLQKHERSASHHNKLSSSPLLSSSEPRPFKCSDCNIAFRIHGHLAKHLRSKMHIMKLECLAKIPFGLYAELERAHSLLTEVNTTDGDQCLESLKALARKVFINDPSKLNQLEVSLSSTTDTSDNS